MRSPEQLASRFRDRGLKVTPQRMCIFDVLHGNRVHPTAEAVYEEARRRMPTLSLKTVYQTLGDLRDMGEIQFLDVGTGASRFDPNVDDHHHLVCVSCGSVRDVSADFPQLVVPESEAAGFRITSTEVVFRGLCAECAGRPTGSADRPGAPADRPGAPADRRGTSADRHGTSADRPAGT